MTSKGPSGSIAVDHVNVDTSPNAKTSGCVDMDEDGPVLKLRTNPMDRVPFYYQNPESVYFTLWGIEDRINITNGLIVCESQLCPMWPPIDDNMDLSERD